MNSSEFHILNREIECAYAILKNATISFIKQAICLSKSPGACPVISLLAELFEAIAGYIAVDRYRCYRFNYTVTIF